MHNTSVINSSFFPRFKFQRVCPCCSLFILSRLLLKMLEQCWFVVCSILVFVFSIFWFFKAKWFPTITVSFYRFSLIKMCSSTSIWASLESVSFVFRPMHNWKLFIIYSQSPEECEVLSNMTTYFSIPPHFVWCLCLTMLFSLNSIVFHVYLC